MSQRRFSIPITSTKLEPRSIGVSDCTEERCGVGRIEPSLSPRVTCWSVHAHLIMDAGPDAPWSLFAARWKDWTEGRGEFKPHYRDPVVKPAAIRDVARYINKADQISPEPGSMPLRLLETLRTELRRKRLPICWGTGRVS